MGQTNDIRVMYNATPDGLPIIVAEVTAWRHFLDWVEGTQLYTHLKEGSMAMKQGHYSGATVTSTNIQAVTDKETLEFNLRGVAIQRSADLPTEVLIKFLENYPLYQTYLQEERDRIAETIFTNNKFPIDNANNS